MASSALPECAGDTRLGSALAWGGKGARGGGEHVGPGLTPGNIPLHRTGDEKAPGKTPRLRAAVACTMLLFLLPATNSEGRGNVRPPRDVRQQHAHAATHLVRVAQQRM